MRKASLRVAAHQGKVHSQPQVAQTHAMLTIEFCAITPHKARKSVQKKETVWAAMWVNRLWGCGVWNVSEKKYGLLMTRLYKAMGNCPSIAIHSKPTDSTSDRFLKRKKNWGQKFTSGFKKWLRTLSCLFRWPMSNHQNPKINSQLESNPSSGLLRYWTYMVQRHHHLCPGNA